MNQVEIKKIIPYDKPFLFVTEVEKINDKEIVGYYQTSKDDYYFAGHFVDYKIMPGVLVIEALAQLVTILLRKTIGHSHVDYHFLAYDVNSCQFFKPIFPGDKIILQAEVLGLYSIPEQKTQIARIKASAFVNEEIKVEARFSVVIINKKNFTEKYKKP